MFAKAVAASVLVCATIQSRNLPMLDPQKQTMSITVDTSVLAALAKLGSYTRTPIGIVLTAGKPNNLCGQNRKISVHDRPIDASLDELLAKSGYIWSLDNGVIVIRPAQSSDQVSRVLNLKFDRFGGMQTSMQGVGIILANQIFMRLHPEAGVIGDILSSPDAEQFPQLDARNASVEQILNQLVTLGSKGMWFLQLSQGFEHNRDFDLHTYSYKDDANALLAICGDIKY
jgi:hypothetical protein